MRVYWVILRVQDVTAEELKVFFETLTGVQVSEVSIARDNADLVSLSVQRGNIVRRLEILEEEISIGKDKVRVGVRAWFNIELGYLLH